MTTLKLDVSDQAEKAKQLAQAGRIITEISEEMGITWGEARNLVPNSSWRGAKVRITNRLNTKPRRQTHGKGGNWQRRPINTSISYTMRRNT